MRDARRPAVEALAMHPALRGARRVLVLGGCGAGKSTLARRLATELALPVVHLDLEYFAPGWIEPEQSVWRERLAELAARDRWVIDGNHAPMLPQRLARADAAVWLDLPTATCFLRVLTRIAKNYGRTRADMAPGCREKIDPEFLRYVLRFRSEQRPKLLAALGGYAGPLVHVRSPAEANRLFGR